MVRGEAELTGERRPSIPHREDANEDLAIRGSCQILHMCCGLCYTGGNKLKEAAYCWRLGLRVGSPMDLGENRKS
ncbi:hypothetical protein UY3_12707 [Chelonia mydas]|uniref:Uncharacterized protein n=1 Tax=Chelonia mydas TaxID=8469 RepID=M7B3W9_CHEMY|nr:hypothetical protein UY3_12707 [Chelonia mydas]